MNYRVSYVVRDGYEGHITNGHADLTEESPEAAVALVTAQLKARFPGFCERTSEVSAEVLLETTKADIQS